MRAAVFAIMCVRRAVRILFHKRSDERHTLEIVREDGRREAVDCETRSTLVHDLLHYATEAEAGLESGLWGNLARGKTLADVDDRSGAAMGAALPELMAVERIVGALSAIAKGRSAREVAAGIQVWTEAAGLEVPPWLTGDLVDAVQERLRRLLGRWRATPFGEAMDLPWPAR